MPGWPSNISKLTFGGRLPRGDVWSMGVYLDDGGQDIGQGYGEFAGARAQITAAVTDWYTSQAASISRVALLDWFKLNRIGPDGRYVSPSTNEWEHPKIGGQPGGFSADWWQHVSLALTHRAAEQRGPATRGRVYPPAVVATPTAAGVMPRDWLQPYVNAWSDCLQDISDAFPGALGTPLIVSSGTKAAPNTGTRRPIVRVQAGDVLDIQQRRRNADPEEYTSATSGLGATQPPGAIGQ